MESRHTKTQMQKPERSKRGRAAKYDWGLLRTRGWLFVPMEHGHRNQGCSLRSAAKASGMRVSAMLAVLGDAKGYLVELRK